MRKRACHVGQRATTRACAARATQYGNSGRRARVLTFTRASTHASYTVLAAKCINIWRAAGMTNQRTRSHTSFIHNMCAHVYTRVARWQTPRAIATEPRWLVSTDTTHSSLPLARPVANDVQLCRVGRNVRATPPDQSPPRPCVAASTCAMPTPLPIPNIKEAIRLGGCTLG